MANVKISQLTPKGANLASTDLLEISEFDGSGYVTKSVTGQEIIDAAAGSHVISVSGTAPIMSSGGNNPDISITQADTGSDGYLTSTDYINFTNKQEALVSGTNIKTIEGQSLLGSGNIDLTKADVGLANVDNTSDVNKPVSTAQQTALNAKQDTLVSASNIKTINGNSLLGSGNLVLSGGASGVHALLPLASGQSTYASTTSQGLASASTTFQRVYAVPFIPAQNITTSALYMNVAASSGGQARILIYSSLNGLPDQKLYESTNLDCSTTGIKTATTTFNFVAGTTYFLCLQLGATFSVSYINSSGSFPLSISGVGNAFTHVYITASLGSAPTTFGTPTFASGNTPFVGITKA